VIGSDNLLFITTNNLRFLVRGSWPRDPKQTPNTKKQRPPSPLFLQKSYLYCVHVLGKNVFIRYSNPKKFFKKFNWFEKKFCKILNEFGYSRYK